MNDRQRAYLIALSHKGRRTVKGRGVQNLVRALEKEGLVYTFEGTAKISAQGRELVKSWENPPPPREVK